MKGHEETTKDVRTWQDGKIGVVMSKGRGKKVNGMVMEKTEWGKGRERGEKKRAWGGRREEQW